MINNVAEKCKVQASGEKIISMLRKTETANRTELNVVDPSTAKNSAFRFIFSSEVLVIKTCSALKSRFHKFRQHCLHVVKLVVCAAASQCLCSPQRSQVHSAAPSSPLPMINLTHSNDRATNLILGCKQTADLIGSSDPKRTEVKV